MGIVSKILSEKGQREFDRIFCQKQKPCGCTDIVENVNQCKHTKIKEFRVPSRRGIKTQYECIECGAFFTSAEGKEVVNE